MSREANGDAPPRTMTAGDVAAMVGGAITGDASLALRGVNSIQYAAADELTLVSHAKYAAAWKSSEAQCALVTESIVDELEPGRTLIAVNDAEVAMITVLDAFMPASPTPPEGVHASAHVDETASIGRGVCIGPHVSIGRNARIGDRVVLYPGVCIYGDVQIGNDCVLHANGVVRERCRVGERVILQPNVSIGADGFGYRPAADGSGLLKVPHLGGVMIGDDVEIGAGTCIDRGKFGDTLIGAGTKIDNLVQIAHNCTIGRSCIIAALSGLAGSVTLGDGVILAGNVGVTDHVTIGAGSIVGAGSGVMDDIPAGQTWLGSPATESRSTLRQWAAVRKLPELIRSISGARSLANPRPPAGSG